MESLARERNRRSRYRQQISIYSKDGRHWQINVSRMQGIRVTYISSSVDSQRSIDNLVR